MVIRKLKPTVDTLWPAGTMFYHLEAQGTEIRNIEGRHTIVNSLLGLRPLLYMRTGVKGILKLRKVINSQEFTGGATPGEPTPAWPGYSDNFQSTLVLRDNLFDVFSQVIVEQYTRFKVLRDLDLTNDVLIHQYLSKYAPNTIPYNWTPSVIFNALQIAWHVNRYLVDPVDARPDELTRICKQFLGDYAVYFKTPKTPLPNLMACFTTKRSEQKFLARPKIQIWEDPFIL